MEEEKLTRLDAFVKSLREAHNIPGVGIAVVHNGATVLTKGYGVMDHTQKKTVSETTKFCIGSITKGFTATLLASILSHYNITWDTPLCQIFDGDIQFAEKFRTEKACLRDLLAHKMGIELGETDFGWLCGGLKRHLLHKKVRHLPIAGEFRASMMYNNFMYTLAAQVAEKLTDSSWEGLLRERFFELLGMEDTTFISEQDSDWTNVARPHLAHKGGVTEIDLEVHRRCGCVGPAASICSSARDMAKWMLFLLNKGTVADVPIIPSAHLRECWKPQSALPCGKQEWDGYAWLPEFPVTESRDTYGFGWYRGSYRGYRYLAHSGELFGFDALLTLYPDMQLGIYTSFNGPGGEAAFIGNQILHYHLTDSMLGLEPWLDPRTAATFPSPWKPRETFFIPRVQSDIVIGLPATRPLADYAGTFHHDFLGEMSVNVDNQRGTLNLFCGQRGEFMLHPNGEVDGFRLEGKVPLDFLHRVDLYAPSDWMMATFSASQGYDVDSLVLSLFESGPVFKRVEIIPL